MLYFYEYPSILNFLNNQAPAAGEANVHTGQYTHNGKKHKKWWPAVRIADEKQKGLDDEDSMINGDNNSYNEDREQTSHFISSFFDDIGNLQEGTYKLINGSWVRQD